MKLTIQALDHWNHKLQRHEKKEGVLSREQGAYNYATPTAEVDIKRFYAVLQVSWTEGGRSGKFWWWEAKTPVADGLVNFLPMNDAAMEKLIFHKDWVGVGLVDGLWEVRKHGAYVSIWPVLEEERGGRD